MSLGDRMKMYNTPQPDFIDDLFLKQIDKMNYDELRTLKEFCDDKMKELAIDKLKQGIIKILKDEMCLDDITIQEKIDSLCDSDVEEVDSAISWLENLNRELPEAQTFDEVRWFWREILEESL